MPVFQESCAEQIQAQTIIIIHPGSMYLRMGRASDLNPCTLLNAVARRRLSGGVEYKDGFLPFVVPRTKELTQAMEESRLQVSHTLQSCLQSDGRRRYATPPQQIAAFNRRSNPEIQSPSKAEWIKMDKDIIVGDDILSLNPEDNFNIHFPYKRGELNIHSGPGGSLKAVMADLKTIWEYVLTEKMDIPLRDLKHYRAVLVIPDIYNRHYLRELTTLMLCEIGFGGCFLLQDHVAATFGAGLGYACVVDVGDQKTSVSCVEDGISHRNTRRRGMKENLEQALEMQEEVVAPTAVGEEEVVVDAVDSAPIALSNRDLDAPRDFVVGPQQLLGLDHAILQSIDRCPTEDLKRKMYSCILVVGSGMKFQGIGMWLHNRISLQIPYMYRAEQLDIITQPKEMDPGMTAWKGAAILSCLESAQELWIGRQEWERIGVRILRERAPFMW
ncbi:actin-related protein 8 isoform X3 [Vespa velutina]|uniref:actin-related protein 8 isoform X3 n=1 Tax=Vespa velutina TaxID=202808 RepID=UPI001FB220E4|nr:actin-related protein 8 isoform X3 [Vespa velutina]